ncbi:inhibitor of the pro-sigma K processing machinery [Bacillus sp. V-88]|nr:inhibitor of the pro-sigma K processing machinery [Bacillus sp. V-88]SLK01126.1 inhibitor of the pro-sigma K processing machinery [Bacillus sp. V-88]
MLGCSMMKRLVGRLIYLVFTLFIFVLLWKGTAILWEAFVPWNYRTDLFGILIVTPLLIVLSFILSTLAFQYRKDS